MSWDPSTYDDERELTDYVWHNFSNLLTPLEWTVSQSVMFEEKAKAANDVVAKRLRELSAAQKDSQVVEALKDGFSAFRDNVRKRIVGQHCDKVSINRCTACRRIVATPAAQQCLWCGHEWHRQH